MDIYREADTKAVTGTMRIGLSGGGEEGRKESSESSYKMCSYEIHPFTCLIIFNLQLGQLQLHIHIYHTHLGEEQYMSRPHPQW